MTSFIFSYADLHLNNWAAHSPRFSEAPQLDARGSLAVGSEMDIAIQIAADLVAIAHGMRIWVPDLAGAGLCSFDLPFIGLYRSQPSLARPKNWLQTEGTSLRLP
jgi:hypothetical protein